MFSSGFLMFCRKYKKVNGGNAYFETISGNTALVISNYLNPPPRGKIKNYGKIKMLKAKSNCIKDGSPIEPIVGTAVW